MAKTASKNSDPWKELLTTYDAEDLLIECLKYIEAGAVGDVLYHQLDNDEMLRMLTSIQILKDTE